MNAMSVVWRKGCPADSIWVKQWLSLQHKKMGQGLVGSACARSWMLRAASLIPFVQDSVEPGSVIHTDGWQGYASLESKGYKHDVTIVTRKKKTASELLPRVHRVVSLLK